MDSLIFSDKKIWGKKCVGSDEPTIFLPVISVHQRLLAVKTVRFFSAPRTANAPVRAPGRFEIAIQSAKSHAETNSILTNWTAD